MERIVNILGGLGNQMFQFAFALALQAEYPQDVVKINTLCFNGYPLHNGFEIENIFSNARLPHATCKDLVRYAWPWVHYRLWQLGSRILPTRKTMTTTHTYMEVFNLQMMKDKSYFDGYWQSPKFFEKYREKIRRTFDFSPIEKKDSRNYEIVKFIKDEKTAFIHVRQGDYVNHPLFGGICTLKYYESAISIIRNEYNIRRFIIFSNDIAWCKENLHKYLNSCNIIYSDWNKGSESFKDMQLMSLCSAGVIANSSFSWWGAWLSGSDQILAPHMWCKNPRILTDIIPKNWIRINIK